MLQEPGMSDKKSIFKAVNTSSVRNNFSDVVDTVIGKERVMFTRYGKNKAALVTTDDAQVIQYLLEGKDYERILKLARKTETETELIDKIKNSA